MTITNSNAIIQSADPKGHFKEGVLSSGVAVYPGSQVKLQADGSYAPDTSTTAGARGEVLLVVEDHLQGGMSSTQYAAGAHIYMYIPVAGDECMILLKDIAGTADAHPVGEIEMVDGLTGMYIVLSGTPSSAPWELLQAVAAPLGNTLALARRL